jgi:hypothetical protein
MTGSNKTAYGVLVSLAHKRLVVHTTGEVTDAEGDAQTGGNDQVI